MIGSSLPADFARYQPMIADWSRSCARLLGVSITATISLLTVPPLSAQTSRDASAPDEQTPSTSSTAGAALANVEVDQFDLEEPKLGRSDGSFDDGDRVQPPAELEFQIFQLSVRNWRVLEQSRNQPISASDGQTQTGERRDGGRVDGLQNRVEILDKQLEKLRKENRQTLKFHPGRLQRALWISFGGLTLNGLAASLYAFESPSTIALTTSANAAVSLLPAGFTGLAFGSGNPGVSIIATVIDLAAASIPWTGALLVDQVRQGDLINIK